MHIYEVIPLGTKPLLLDMRLKFLASLSINNVCTQSNSFVVKLFINDFRKCMQQTLQQDHRPKTKGHMIILWKCNTPVCRISHLPVCNNVKTTH